MICLVIIHSMQSIQINKITFQYATEKQEDKAALNFHLTQREKKNIMSSPDFLFNHGKFSTKWSIYLIKRIQLDS